MSRGDENGLSNLVRCVPFLPNNKHIMMILFIQTVAIILQPVTTNLANNILYHLAKDISIECKNTKVTLFSYFEPHAEAQFQLAFDKDRNQWDSLKLLEWLLEKFNPVKGTKMLAIFDNDAFTSGFDFVFGEAYYRGRLAATYISRLKQEFYGLKPNPPLFYERLVKEAIHELGHTFGFIHCKNSRCVMYFSTTLGDIDTKERSVCKKKEIF
jgi:archaemetzincin